jgi:hypothetical protein
MTPLTCKRNSNKGTVMDYVLALAIYKVLTLNFCMEHQPNLVKGCNEVVIECVMDEGFENFNFCASEDYLSWNQEEIRYLNEYDLNEE